MAAKKETEVATVKDQANLPVGMDMEELLKDVGAGVQNMGMDDIAVPYLYILQANSPQVNEDSEAYVKDARPGMFYNNVSEEVYDGREIGIEVIPCAYERKYVEWVDRDSGGGFVAEHSIDSNVISECTPNEKGIPVLRNGHLIIETAYHYVYFKNPNTGIWEEIIIPMKSTMLKKSRRWNKTLMGTLIPGTTSRAPRWLYPYRLKTVKETKNSNTWSNYDIERLPDMVNADQYRQCKAFAELFSSGLIVRATETNADNLGNASVGGGGEYTGQTIDGDLDDEMPF
jgi:hypothetical protein